MYHRPNPQYNIQAMGSIKLCQLLSREGHSLSKAVIDEIHNRALFLLQTEDLRYRHLKFDARGLATVLYQFAKLRYGISTEFINAWTNKSIDLIDEFNSQELSNALWALGRLEIHPSDDFIHAWINHATSTIDQFNSQSLSNALWALGRLEIHPSDDFIHAWINHATATINHFNP
ncbi:FAST kinase-like, subdomain 1 family protein [Orientia chuto str. Dubai]|uniref:FAST kinase-like, subdomain 1 family protein n=1 Tax=Orientia chuto str. Dubai TaxID=1359168 RepID=A0A0F3MP83_9RICK|nr:hypothetical protein [Candidatus Orientia mediorientalis]KJV57262.1 FAST kinase-like, subdomain 1 family protein [Orientia chuto str. Dubai]